LEPDHRARGDVGGDSWRTGRAFRRVTWKARAIPLALPFAEGVGVALLVVAVVTARAVPGRCVGRLASDDNRSVPTKTRPRLAWDSPGHRRCLGRPGGQDSSRPATPMLASQWAAGDRMSNRLVASCLRVNGS
jgi:hypothetical protein